MNTSPMTQHTGGRGRSLTPTSADLVDAGFLAVLAVLALLALRTTFDGWTFLAVGIAGLVLGILVGHIATVLRQPLITVAAMTVAVFFLLGTAVAARQQATAGVLPSASSVRTLAEGSVVGWKQLLTTLPPVPDSGRLLVIPYILGLLCGSGGFTMARRLTRPLAPVAAPVLLLVAVLLLGTDQPDSVLLQGVLFTSVALCWPAARARRTRSRVNDGSARLTRLAAGAALLAAAGVLAAVVGPALPGAGGQRVVLRQQVTPPFDVGAYPSPLVGFRKYTKDANQLWDQTLFTVTGAPPGQRVRIATLDGYDGSVWGATEDEPTAPGQPKAAFQRVGARIPVYGPQSGASPATLTVTVGAAYAASDDVNAWLPTVGAATAVEFTGAAADAHTENFRYNLATSAGLVPDRLRAGDRYTVHAVVADRRLPIDAQPFDQPRPSGQIDALAAPRAVQWAGDATDPAARMLAIAKHLHDTGAYSDGGHGEGQFMPGHSVGRLAAFFNGDRPVGDDEQYAAAFALLTREVGMPARVVLGALPGSDGVVRGRDVHAWVEVHVADGTWVPVETSQFMPDVSRKPNVQPPQEVDNTDASIVPPPNAVHPPSSLTDAGAVDGTATRRAPVGDPDGPLLPAWLLAVLGYLGPPLGAISLVCGAITGAKAVRRRYRRTRGGAADQVCMGWRELTDQARDLGAPLTGGTTRRQQARQLAGHGHQVGHLAAIADATVFGPGEPGAAAGQQYWLAVAEARRRMTTGTSRARRVRAALSLRSFLPPRSGVRTT